MKELELVNEGEIKNKIHTIRGVQVMLDSDLADLYEVETKVLNQAVKRNIERFPLRFCFQITEVEYKNLKSQIVTSRYEHGGRRKLPNVFTEKGVSMLAGILRSEKAVQISIQIIDSFISMRKFLSKNALVFQRLNYLEKTLLRHNDKFEEIFKIIESKDIKPDKEIFFDGQMFDSHKFISDLIRSAKKSIILIDNYIDDRTLNLLNKRNKDINVTIYTKNITQNLKQDLKKFNSQYESIEIKQFYLSHDRFLIIDEKEIYHIGASLKDLGKKWFAFSKMDIENLNLFERLK